MSVHRFLIETVRITGVGYGGMDTRYERTLRCSCGRFSASLYNHDKDRLKALLVSHAISELCLTTGLDFDFDSIQQVDKGTR